MKNYISYCRTICHFLMFLIIILPTIAASGDVYNTEIKNWTGNFKNKQAEEVAFTFPRDCKKFKKFKEQEKLYSQADTQRKWNDLRGVEELCYYSELKSLGRAEAANDFVSKYDFMNGSLDDFPYTIHCNGVVSSNEFLDLCDRLTKEKVDYSYLEFALLGDDAMLRPDNKKEQERIREIRSLPRDINCKLTNGGFEGEIKVVDGIIKCPVSEAGYDWQIFRISFRDVNANGFLDAIVGIVHKAGTAYQTGYNLFTRTSPEQKRFTNISLDEVFVKSNN